MTENVLWHSGSVTREARQAITGGEGLTVWLTGLSGSGKSTIAHAVEEILVARSRAAYVLDGDNLRHGLNSDLGFSAEARSENVRRVGEVARLMADAGVVVLAPVISPFTADRDLVRKSHEAAGIRFLEVFVDAPLEVAEQRDPKGLYAKARAGEITDMTGIDSPYESPERPDLRLDTATRDPVSLARDLLAKILEGEE
jgi:bifunctional enzyme CysN/CysC